MAGMCGIWRCEENKRIRLAYARNWKKLSKLCKLEVHPVTNDKEAGALRAGVGGKISVVTNVTQNSAGLTNVLVF